MVKGVVPPFMYAHDGKRTWVLHFPVRPQFTAPEIDKYAMERRNRREGYGQNNNNNNNTTNSSEHIFKNTSYRTTLSAYALIRVSSRHGLKHIDEQVTHGREAYASVTSLTVTSAPRIYADITEAEKGYEWPDKYSQRQESQDSCFIYLGMHIGIQKQRRARKGLTSTQRQDSH